MLEELERRLKHPRVKGAAAEQAARVNVSMKGFVESRGVDFDVGANVGHEGQSPMLRAALVRLCYCSGAATVFTHTNPAHGCIQSPSHSSICSIVHAGMYVSMHYTVSHVIIDVGLWLLRRSLPCLLAVTQLCCPVVKSMTEALLPPSLATITTNKHIDSSKCK